MADADEALRHVLAVRELDELTRLRAENERLQNVHTFLLDTAADKLWEPKWVYNHVVKTPFMIACENGELDAAKFLASLPGGALMVHWMALGGNNAYAYTKDALDQLEDDDECLENEVEEDFRVNMIPRLRNVLTYLEQLGLSTRPIRPDSPSQPGFEEESVTDSELEESVEADELEESEEAGE